MSTKKHASVPFLACMAAVALFAAGEAQAQSARNRDGSPRKDPNEGRVQTEAISKPFPFGHAWTGVSLGGKPFPGERPTLVVDDNLRGKGFGGCNTFSASMYPIKDQGFAVGPLAVTKRACDKAISASEHALLLALRMAQKWDLEAGRLVIKTSKGDIVFERAL